MSLLEDEKSANEREKLLANETAKLMATYVNGLAIAVFAVGGLAPMFSQKLPIGATPASAWWAPVSALFCLCVSGALHWAARGFLKELR